MTKWRIKRYITLTHDLEIEGYAGDYAEAVEHESMVMDDNKFHRECTGEDYVRLDDEGNEIEEEL